MKVDLSGRAALVTGGASGIGQAIAASLAASGAQVVIGDISPERSEAAAGAIATHGGNVRFVRQDVTAGADWDRVLGEIAARGPLDILVNNAGGAIARESGPFGTETTQADYDLLMDVNFRSAVLCCQAAAPMMKAQKSGNMVNISSQTGVAPLPGGPLAIYGASKAAVAMYTRNLAAELGPHGIRVNAIAPGIVMTARIAAQAKKRGIGTGEQEAAIPLRRFADVEDLCGPLEFLVTDLSRYVTGQVLSVCGGVVLTPS